MSIQGGASELCQKGFSLRGHGGEMDQEGRGGLGEEGYHFAAKVVRDFVAVGVVQGNPQVRQRRGQDLRVNFDHIMGYFGDGPPMPQLSGMLPIHHGKLNGEPWLEFYPGHLLFRGQKELKISADTSHFMDGQRFFDPFGHNLHGSVYPTDIAAFV